MGRSGSDGRVNVASTLRTSSKKTTDLEVVGVAGTRNERRALEKRSAKAAAEVGMAASRQLYASSFWDDCGQGIISWMVEVEEDAEKKEQG